LFMLNSLGDGSTLSLDFTTGVLDSRLTFSRTSGGTYVGNDGFVYGVDFATSSSLAIGTGSKSVTLTATAGQSRRYEIGQTVYIANGANNMSGAVTAYSSATQVLTINATSTSGSGSFTSWIVGNASARFDYDPTTLAPRGLLIEGSASTLNQYSEDFSNAYWSKPNASVSSSSVTGPDNVAGTTRRIVEDNTTNQHGIRRSFSMTSGVTYTMSVFAKPGSYDSFGFEMYASASNNAKAEVTSISGNTQTVTSASGVNATLARTPMTASGWYRYALTFTSTATQSGDFNILIKQTNSYAGNGTNYMDVYGFMLETSSGASSYIPTGASTGNRAADSCVMTGTNFSSWFNATEGTLLAHAIRSRTSDIGRIASVNDNTANESIELGADTTGEFIVVDGGSTLATISPGTVTANTAFKIAGAYKLNDVQAALGGTLGTADTSVTLPTVDRLMIGQQAGGSPVYLNGTISLLKYWPTRLTNAQLQSLTT
jgi:hypothetical protein